jgi:hypothetical protein
MTMESEHEERRRRQALDEIEAKRQQYNTELGREYRNERIREGREDWHEEHEERRFQHKVLAALAAILEKLQGGAKLAFRLILQQGDTMATIQISSIQRVGGTTGVMTATPHGLNVGDSFAISGVSDPTLNSAQGAAVVASAGFGPSNFTFTQAGADTAVVTGGTLTTAGGASGSDGTGVVGTPSTFGLTVVDQTGATQPLPAGVTPSVAVVDGNGGTTGATGSISADNSTVTVSYTAAGTYTVTVSDASGKVASASATVVVTAPAGKLSFKLTQTS